MKRNNIELDDLNNKSENLIEEINYKIAELLEMNPDYKVILHNIKIITCCLSSTFNER